MIILGGMKESEKELSELEKTFLRILKSPSQGYEYTLYYTHLNNGDSLELTFKSQYLKDIETVKEIGKDTIRQSHWSRTNNIENFRFLKYEETIIKR
jgi:hypothetical protein